MVRVTCAQDDALDLLVVNDRFAFLSGAGLAGPHAFVRRHGAQQADRTALPNAVGPTARQHSGQHCTMSTRSNVNLINCQLDQLCVRRTPPPPERQTQSSHSINTAPNTLHRHGAQHLTLTHAPLNNSAQKQSAYEQAVKWTAGRGHLPINICQ